MRWTQGSIAGTAACEADTLLTELLPMVCLGVDVKITVYCIGVLALCKGFIGQIQKKR